MNDKTKEYLSGYNKGVEFGRAVAYSQCEILARKLLKGITYDRIVEMVNEMEDDIKEYESSLDNVD